MTRTHNHSEICDLEKKYGLQHVEKPSVSYVLKLISLDNYDAKDDTQRRMAWFSLFGMLVYPLLVFLADLLGLQNAGSWLSDMAGVYFASVSVIVSIFFGANAYSKKHDPDLNNEINPDV